MKISKDTPPPSKAMSNFFKNTPPSKPQKVFEGGVFLVNTADYLNEFAWDDQTFLGAQQPY